ncbi:MAG: cadherin-like beta sandwich domain-containing protein, partial [Eubacteriales bacterium]|nr:cadherin-like beta sandwich domain-containing protein [Eubacteriales bacterium]
MKQARKKLLGIVTIAVMLLSMLCQNSMSSKAEDVSVIIALSSSSVSKGDTVTVTISVNGSSLSAYTMYVSYSSGLLQFNSGSGAVVAGGGGTVNISGTGAGTVTLSFTAIAEGQASVSTSSAEFYDINGTQLSVAHAGVVIQVGGDASTEQPTTEQPTTEKPSTANPTTEEGKSDNSNLVRLQLTNGTLEPEFVYYQTSYFVQLDKDVTSLGVVAEAEDSKAKVQINGADELKPGENKVTIVVTAENGSTKTYSIRVVVGELLEDVQIEIAEKKYAFVNEIEKEYVPEGYIETTVSYGDWNIVAYESPNKQLILIGLKEIISVNDDSQDADQTTDRETDEQIDEIIWFIYDEENQKFVPYEEVLAANNRYVIMELPEGVEIPDGYAEAELTINDKIVLAYRSEYATDADMYLVYAMNIYGNTGFYLYDRAEQTFMRYAPDDILQPETATVADATVIDAKPVTNNKTDDTFSRMILIISLVGCICLLIIFVVLSFVQISKKRQLREELDLAESMVEQLVASNNANKVGVLKPVEDVQKNTQPVTETKEETG